MLRAGACLVAARSLRRSGPKRRRPTLAPNERDWTLEQMAEKCDLDLKHLQKIESGQLNVTLVTLVRLAVGLKKPMAALFTDQPKAKRAER
jgi:transcriptional regulator with XRE-family HTH domain